MAFLQSDNFVLYLYGLITLLTYDNNHSNGIEEKGCEGA